MYAESDVHTYVINVFKRGVLVSRVIQPAGKAVYELPVFD